MFGKGGGGLSLPQAFSLQQWLSGKAYFGGFLPLFQVGLLIFAFYFTSKILLYYQHLLVNMEQRSKKDLDSEQVSIS